MTTVAGPSAINPDVQDAILYMASSAGVKGDVVTVYTSAKTTYDGEGSGFNTCKLLASGSAKNPGHTYGVLLESAAQNEQVRVRLKGICDVSCIEPADGTDIDGPSTTESTIPTPLIPYGDATTNKRSLTSIADIDNDDATDTTYRVSKVVGYPLEDLGTSGTADQTTAALISCMFNGFGFGFAIENRATI